MILYAINEGLRLGVSYVEARYQKNAVDSLIMRSDRVVGASTEAKEGVGIRVIVDGSLGFAATNNLSKEGIKKALDAAILRAKNVSSLRKTPIEFSKDYLGKVSYSVTIKKRLEDLSVEEKLKLGKELWKEVQSSVKEVKVPITMFEISTSLEEKLIMNSDGGHIHSLIPRVNVGVNIVLLSTSKGSLQRMIELGGSGGTELIDQWRITDKIRDEVPKLENVLLKGVEPPKEPVDLVVGSEVVGLIVHESAGHPMEADRILGREAAQAGESFVKPEMIGNFRVGSDLVTVIEDPTIPGSSGYYLFDDEGVPARPRYLYKDGIINEPLHNRHTAKIFNTTSNGAARAMDYNSEPIIRMSNTYFKPGTSSFEELLEEIRLGVFMKSYMEWNIDDTRWNMRFVGLEAYMIRKGELAEPVKNPVLEVTTKGFYSRVTDVGKELRFYPGICGKGEPGQGVPVWFGGPDLKISKIRLGVISK